MLFWIGISFPILITGSSMRRRLPRGANCADVYSDEEYYSDGDFDICDGCFGDFKRIDIAG